MSTQQQQPLVRPYPKDPVSVGRLFRKFWEKRSVAPFGLGHDPSMFTSTILAEDTEVFEIGDFGGAIIVTAILGSDLAGPYEETIARPHILIWSKRYYGQAGGIRSAALELMQERGVHRLVAEVAAENAKIRRFVEAVGFRLVGRFRDRIRPSDGGLIDTLLYDALQSDLGGQDERQRTGN